MAEAPEETGSRIRRILVLTDTSRAGRAALEAAAELAARQGAELVTLFVEDADILRVAGLPFAREVGEVSGKAHPMDLRQLERRLKGQAEEIRRFLRQLETRHPITWSLHIARGRAESEALAVATHDDLLVVGKRGWARLPHRRLGSTTRQLLGQAHVSLMVYSQAQVRGHPILVLFDDPDAGPRALALATYIAPRPGHPLVLLLPPGTPEETDQLHRAAARSLTDQGLEAEVRQLTGDEVQALARTVRRESPHALVMGHHSPLLTGTPGQQLVEELDIPVVMAP
jgi:nucleotide-binding universal stress UspA family protein